jgi:hypothetical protein
MNIADKIKKLLALAQSSNPHEASLAAARAQELMVKYALDEAQLAGTPGRVEEKIESEAMEIGRRGAVQHWHTMLADALSRSFFCRVYFVPRGDIYMVGRSTDREALRATYLYLRGEITRMSHSAWEDARPTFAWAHGAQLAGQGIKWIRAFHVGAVATVRERLTSNLRQLSTSAPATASAAGGPAAPSVAIVLAARQEAVDKYVAEKLNLQSRHSSRPLNSSGYKEGQKAGWSLNLDKRASPSKRLGS